MIVKPSPENIARAAEIIRSGELVAFPTETVYGLGADATNQQAAKRIFEVKQRPFEDPLIVHVASISEIDQVANVPRGSRMAEQLERLSGLWPGPLTVVVPRSGRVAEAVCGGLDSVAVRVPAHPVAQALLKASAIPIAAPSANPFSYVSPTSAEHVESLLGSQIEMILDGGNCQVGIESTIVSLIEDTPAILRPGKITAQQLQELIGPVAERPRKAATTMAPGMMDHHYSPRTPLAFYGAIAKSDYPKRVGLVRFAPDMRSSEFPYSAVTTLSSRGNLDEVAQKLFSALREHDSLGLELILVDSCPEEGIGVAIMDRLRKACAARR